ncbi:MAG TPA: MerR family transcriptional regulator [Candidatus Acidoferrum sp.]|nr:MerR family transcriptional regulator [Candidatus Acidoferrum sp.]
MLRISEFARAGKVTIRALRFYDEVGLLSPAHVVPENGYRRYSPAQFAQLNQIQAFKDMGFSLQEIRELLQKRLAPPELRAILEERREVLRKRLRDDADRLERIEARLSGISSECPQSPLVIMLRETPRQLVVSLREKLQSYSQVDELFTTLERRVDPQALCDHRGAIFHRCLAGDGEIDCEAIRFLKYPVSAIQGLKVYESQRTQVAFTYHYGSEDSIGTTYQSMTGWIAGQGYRLSGAKREIYWEAPQTKGEISDLTEIQFPVTRVRGAARSGQRRASQRSSAV